MPDKTITEQGKAFAKTLASLVDRADRVVLACGGSKQAEEIKRVLDAGREAGITPGQPFDTIVGMSEGFLGFNVEQLISNALIEKGRQDLLPVTAILTRTADGAKNGLPTVLEAKAIRTLIDGTCRYLLAGTTGGIPVKYTKDGWTGEYTLHSVYMTAAAVADAAGSDTLLLILADDADDVPADIYTAESAREAAQNMAEPDSLIAAALFVEGAPNRTAMVCRARDLKDMLDTPDGRAGAVVKSL